MRKKVKCKGVWVDRSLAEKWEREGFVNRRVAEEWEKEEFLFRKKEVEN